MKEFVVYTSLIGAYDVKLLKKEDVKNPEYLDKFEFICYTYQKRLLSDLWSIKDAWEKWATDGKYDKPRTSYWYKTNPHLIRDLEPYEISVWMDSSVWQLDAKVLYHYCKNLEASEKSLLIERHPGRDCIYDELEANCRLNKDDVNAMRAHVGKYQKEGMPKKFGMVETGLQFRKHKDKELIEFQEALWFEMTTKTRRDQLSWTYVQWKKKFKNFDLFTFQQKCTILMFKDHPHRPEHKEKVLLVGPWQGEIGWEIFAWQGYIRWLVGQEPFDKVVVGCEPGHEFFYQDIADQVIITEAKGTKKGPQLNGKDPYFKIKNTENKDLRLVKPTWDLCFNALSNLDKQEFKTFKFPEEFKKKYGLEFEEINLALEKKEIPQYLREQLGLPKKNNFKIIVIGGPAEKYIHKSLESIINQTNVNWECQVVLTPVDGDKSFDIAKKFESEKLKVTKTKKGNYVIKNIQEGLRLLNPDEDDIIITVDADDWLANPNVLTTVDKYYMENPELLVTYGSWQVYPNHLNIPSNCRPYTDTDFKKGIRKTLFRGTHLRTMRYKVWKAIPESDLKNEKGEIFTACGDVAIMTPAIEIAGQNRSKFIPETLYIYNRETDFNEDKESKLDNRLPVIEISRKSNHPPINLNRYRIMSLLDKSFPHGRTVMNYDFQNFESKITWDRQNLGREAIFFTDMTLQNIDKFTNPEKYCLLIEPRSIFPQAYEMIKKINHKFTRVLTFDKELLNLGQNYEKILYGGAWIEPKYQEIYPKTKTLSIIASKMNRTEGHKLRHAVIKQFGDKMDVFFFFYNPISTKLPALKDYQFQIVIENSKLDNYASEKIMDCFSTGTIPIYWGCPNLEEAYGFDMNGIIRFNSLSELDNILRNLKIFKKMKKAVEFNFEKCKEYQVMENWIYNNIFKDKFRKE